MERTRWCWSKFLANHTVCATTVAARLLLDRAATPPRRLRRGVSPASTSRRNQRRAAPTKKEALNRRAGRCASLSEYTEACDRAREAFLECNEARQKLRYHVEQHGCDDWEDPFEKLSAA